MKKLLAILLAMAMVFSLAACGKKPAGDANTGNTAKTDGEEAPFHIGICTGTVSQSEDEPRGAESMLAKYGDSKDGGYVTLKNYPDNYMAEQETTIQQIVSFADDPKMKVVVVNQGPPGTAAAFKQIKEKRPDILCFVANSQEDPNLIEGIADLVVDPDQINRGYLIPLAAQKMGAKKFVHVTFPRHMSIELLSLRKDIMEATCDKIGMEFIMETAPDPMSDIGIPGAQNFILEQMPAWVKQYGKETAFFATNDSHTEPMLLRVAELGAYFVEQDLPSPILGYTGALSVDVKDAAGDWPEILKRVEEKAVEMGAAGRMGLWAFSFGFSTTQALAEIGKRTVEGTADYKKPEDFKKVLEEFTPGAVWGVTTYVDRVSREEKKNHYLTLQDTYVLGKGYLGMTDVEVPDVYKLLDEYEAKKNK